jgi:glycosyltransferase involved in cell wall biosynthesis
MSPPLVSILLPTYKRARYLAEAIPSALAQTYSPIELIILDDASPDDTPEVVRPYESDSRVRYIRHPQNRGLPGNWRAGLELAQGEFVCILEDDDLFHPTIIERLVEPLRADPQMRFAFCDHWVVRADGTRDPEATETFTRNYGRAALSEGSVPDPARTAFLHQSVNLTAVMFQRSLLPPDVIASEAQGAMDIWLVYNSLRGAEGGSVHYIPDRLMDYRVHGDGMTYQAPLYVSEGLVYVYSQIAADEGFRAIHHEVKRKLHGYQTALGFAYLKNGRTGEARSLFADARRSGVSLRAMMGSVVARTGPPGVSLFHATARLRQKR